MTNNNNPHHFWSGFAVGTLGGTLLMYLIGTKKGREMLKKVLEHSESYEHSFEELLEVLQTSYRAFQVETEEEKPREELSEVLEKVKQNATTKKVNKT